MEKKFVKRTVEELRLYNLEGQLSEAITMLFEMQARHQGKNLILEAAYDIYNGNTYLVVQVEELETDEELKARLDTEKDNLEWERQKYLELKKKFEKC